MPHSIVDVIRMAGHLLEHNTGTKAAFNVRNGRACYCFIGAYDYCIDNLKYNDEESDRIKFIKAAGFDPKLSIITQWEGANVTDEDRIKIAKRMQQYVG